MAGALIAFGLLAVLSLFVNMLVVKLSDRDEERQEKALRGPGWELPKTTKRREETLLKAKARGILMGSELAKAKEQSKQQQEN